MVHLESLYVCAAIYGLHAVDKAHHEVREGVCAPLQGHLHNDSHPPANDHNCVTQYERQMLAQFTSFSQRESLL